MTIKGFFSHYLENQMPFGGVNQSGMGSYHGILGSRRFLMSAQFTYTRPADISDRVVKDLCFILAMMRAA